MTPLKLSTVWHRRFYEVSFIISLALGALFLVDAFTSLIPSNLQVGMISGIAALVAAVGSAACLFLHKKLGDSFVPSLLVFVTVAISIAAAIVETGELDSPLLALWILIAFFSAIFGAFGWVAAISIAGAAFAYLYIDSDTDATSAIHITLVGILPAIAGALVWRENKSSQDESHRTTKNLANELSEVAAKSEIIINAIGDGVMAIDSKGTIELINPAAQKILGWGKRDAIMLNYKSILKLNDENNNEIDPSLDPIQQVLNTNQQARGEKLTAVTQSGKRISIAITVSPIGNPGSGVIAVFSDTTKERAEGREQAEFISTASHEMRTPVASIEGYLGLAMNQNTAQIDDRARGFITKAQESAQHLGRLFQDLLDVSKSEDGRMTSVPRVVDVLSLTGDIVQGLSMKAQEKGLRMIFKPAENIRQKKIMPVLYANQDNNHIREVMNNLIENAIKYTIQGEIVVDIKGTDDKVIISVKDSGLGIPPEDMSHLFQKFYRVDNVDRQDIGGTGLGLFLSRRLAESMQGRLWAESTYGSGSTFFLEIPRIDSSEAQRIKEQQESQLAQAQQQQQPQPTQEFVPDMTPMAAPAAAPAQAAPPVQQPQQTPTAPQQATTPSEVKPATTVPRGASLSSEQKAAHVRQLQELARQQQEGAGGPTGQ